MEIYGVRELAVKLGISTEKVYELMKNGQLEHSKIGNKLVISERSLEKFLEDTRVKSKKVINKNQHEKILHSEEGDRK